MRDERIDEENILSAARQAHGMESLLEIKHAILERDGAISVIPRKPEQSQATGT